MAFFQCNIRSGALGDATTFNIIYPERPGVKKYPTLYLLHGYSDDHTVWMRRTPIERYVEKYQLAVVMPDVQRSFYCDYRGQIRGQFWKYVSQELISVTRRMFYLSERREDTFVAGLSMGGFGAFKLALNCPETFAAGASISGALDMNRLLRGENWDDKNELRLYMDDLAEFPGSINDLFSAAQKTDKLAVKPRLFQCCGTGDFLYEANIKFREMVKNLSYDYTYEEGPGEHDWEYFDIGIQMILPWLGLERV